MRLEVNKRRRRRMDKKGKKENEKRGGRGRKNIRSGR